MSDLALPQGGAGNGSATSKPPTALWIKEHACGLEVAEPLEKNLPELFQYLANAPGALIPFARRLTELDETVFIQPITYMREVIEDLLGEERIK